MKLVLLNSMAESTTTFFGRPNIGQE
jgi:hypothetical protein